MLSNKKTILSTIFVLLTLATLGWFVFFSDALANVPAVAKIRLIKYGISGAYDNAFVATISERKFPEELTVQDVGRDGSYTYFMSGKITNFDVEGRKFTFQSKKGQDYKFLIPLTEIKNGVEYLSISVLNEETLVWEKKDYILNSQDLRFLLLSKQVLVNWIDTRSKTELDSFATNNNGDFSFDEGIVNVGIHVTN